jgi:hypothetical protein
LKDEELPPLQVDLGLDSDVLEVGEIYSPHAFDIGFSSQIPDGVLIYFHPPDNHPESHPHVVAFRGAAADKLLQTFYNILFTASTGQEESPGSAKQPKKKITLH